MCRSLIGFIDWLVEWRGCETVAHTQRQAPHDETPVELRSLAECELAIMQTIARHRDALGRHCDGSWTMSSCIEVGLELAHSPAHGSEEREDLEQELVRNHRHRRTLIDQRSNHRHRRDGSFHP